MWIGHRCIAVNRRLATVLRTGATLFLVAAPSPPSQGSQSVTLGWDPCTDASVAGYMLYYGRGHRQYGHRVDVGHATTWTVSELQDGVTYYFAVTAYTSNRVESRFSNEASHFTTRPKSPLTVITNNFGTVSPDWNGSSLVIGSTYELRAVPAAGKVFAGWSGDVTASTKRLTFVMQSNMVLRADFAPHPLAGSYNGLFYEPDGVRQDRSGFFTAEMGTNGSFTASLRLSGSILDLTGALDLQGEAQVLVRRPDAPPLTLSLRWDPANGADQLTGWLSDGSWKAALLADRAISDATPDFGIYRGRYTLVISPSADPGAGPAGSGFAAVVVGRKGKVSLVGELADGQPFSQAVPVSRRGEWPFYASLYGGKGSILGWLTFTNQGTNDVLGLLNWTKPARLGARYYPLGFTNQCVVTGSGFDTNQSLNLTNALLVLGGGHLTTSLTNTVTLAGTELLSDSGDLRLACTIDPTSGLFGGTFVDPGTGSTNRLRGVILQKQNRGVGYLRDTNQTGWIRLEGEPRMP